MKTNPWQTYHRSENQNHHCSCNLRYEDQQDYDKKLEEQNHILVPLLYLQTHLIGSFVYIFLSVFTSD